MNTSASCRRHGSQVNDEVPNLTKEVVLVGIPVAAGGVVRVRVNDSDTLESSRSLDSGDSVGVTNELGVIILD